MLEMPPLHLNTHLHTLHQRLSEMLKHPRCTTDLLATLFHMLVKHSNIRNTCHINNGLEMSLQVIINWIQTRGTQTKKLVLHEPPTYVGTTHANRLWPLVKCGDAPSCINHIGCARNNGTPQNARTIYVKERVLHHIENHPEGSTRGIARARVYIMPLCAESSKRTCCPPTTSSEFRRSPRPTIHNGWLSAFGCSSNNIVLGTDEATFNRDVIINIHNDYQWVGENPHAIMHSHNQHQFMLNVWGRIVGKTKARLIGERKMTPFFCSIMVHSRMYPKLCVRHVTGVWFEGDAVCCVLPGCVIICNADGVGRVTSLTTEEGLRLVAAVVLVESALC
ncbi:hypothetical protein PR048_013333 [Dryococelus australis]|uniref:Uncharacterized protein n=1 Tax=Dryococelus australis TaxID=614101 RepID=A0ABQ9HRV9_9NEOP|nr:hypothetical protein PR048_013333 [Dryococelus australis]